MNMKKFVTITALIVCMVFAAVGCASAPAEESSAAPSESAEASTETSASAESSGEALSGTVSMSGSTSMEQIANALKEAFMAENPDVTIDVQLGGSSVGLQDAESGKSDIGNASREMKEERDYNGRSGKSIYRRDHQLE